MGSMPLIALFRFLETPSAFVRLPTTQHCPEFCPFGRNYVGLTKPPPFPFSTQAMQPIQQMLSNKVLHRLYSSLSAFSPDQKSVISPGRFILTGDGREVRITLGKVQAGANQDAGSTAGALSCAFVTVRLHLICVLAHL